MRAFFMIGRCCVALLACVALGLCLFFYIGDVIICLISGAAYNFNVSRPVPVLQATVRNVLCEFGLKIRMTAYYYILSPMSIQTETQ